MFNEELNSNHLLLLNKAKENTQFIIDMVNYFIGYFMAKDEILKKNTNKNMPLISNSNKGDEIMKFKGKTIFKNKKCNTWYTRYRQNGQQFYISGKTQKDVLDKLKYELNYIAKEKIKTKSLLSWYYEWLELFKKGKVKEATIRDYEKSLKNIDDKILNKDIRKIETIDILKNLNNISAERSKQKVYELLKTLFDVGKKHNIIKNNIMEVIEKPKHQKEKGIALDSTEQIKFINYCKKYIYGDLFLITLYEGLRIGEILALTPNDIDLENKKLIINKSLNEKSEFDTTKNYQSNRVIPIFDNALEILKKYKNTKNKRIFNFSYSVPQKHIKIICRELNIREISPHDLRHTFITNCKNKQIPEHIIQTWVGHKIGSIVTSTIYTHANEEDSKKYIDKVNF